MSEALLFQALELMVFGMGVVFTFLVLLAHLTRLMSSFARRLTPNDTDCGDNRSGNQVKGTTRGLAAMPGRSQVGDGKLTSAEIPAHTIKIIQLAIKQYQQRANS